MMMKLLADGKGKPARGGLKGERRDKRDTCRERLGHGWTGPDLQAKQECEAPQAQAQRCELTTESPGAILNIRRMAPKG